MHNENNFPSTFKKVKVIPLYKYGNSANNSKFRPISIVSVLSKPLEKYINKNLLLYFYRCNLLHPIQSGFRKKKHSCQTALTSLVQQWLTNIDNNELNGIRWFKEKKKKKKNTWCYWSWLTSSEIISSWNVKLSFGTLSSLSHQKKTIWYFWYQNIFSINTEVWRSSMVCFWSHPFSLYSKDVTCYIKHCVNSLQMAHPCTVTIQTLLTCCNIILSV